MIDHSLGLRSICLSFISESCPPSIQLRHCMIIRDPPDQLVVSYDISAHLSAQTSSLFPVICAFHESIDIRLSDEENVSSTTTSRFFPFIVVIIIFPDPDTESQLRRFSFV